MKLKEKFNIQILATEEIFLNNTLLFLIGKVGIFGTENKPRNSVIDYAGTGWLLRQLANQLQLQMKDVGILPKI